MAAICNHRLQFAGYEACTNIDIIFLVVVLEQQIFYRQARCYQNLFLICLIYYILIFKILLFF